MKELREIIAAWEARRRHGQTAALATVVRVDGSSYRRPGARMLVLPDGETVGSVSGGCLEADVVERAQKVRETGGPAVVTYDTTDEGDVLFGVGLGCQGIVRVLIERLAPGDEAALSLPAELLARQEAGVLATVYGRGEAGSLDIGDRLRLSSEGESLGPEALRAEARRVLDAEASASKTVEIPGGRAEVFFEFLQPPLPLVIFGAGHDAPPLARLAKELGWHVTLVDHRAAYATRDRFPGADAVRLSPREGLTTALRLNGRTAAVIMTHNYVIDRALLAALLPSPVRYLGVLGPKRRTEGLLAELREDGQSVTDVMQSRLHSPIGLDIGAETPEQIALAIVAEIQAQTAGRAGGFLRGRHGPIYDPAVAEPAGPALAGERPRCPRSA